MSGTERAAPIVLGRITGAWGVKGWIRIHPFGDDPLSWKKMAGLWVGAGEAADPWSVYELQQLKTHGDGVVAQLAGIEDRSAAENLAGRLVGAPREALPEPAEGEYYWGDLVGLAVTNSAGDSIGRVKELIAGTANDVLVVVADDGSEKLLPFVKAVVLAVDRLAGRMVVAWERDW